MCAIDDCEPWQVCRTETREARKQHVCTECQRSIQQGETYQHVTGLMDNYWSTFRTCRHCEAAGQWLVVACYGYPLTMLLDELQEHRNEYPTSAVLDDLCRSVTSKWADGTDPIPDVAVLRADAERCIRELTAA